jgi:arginyl-tRNA synthetase
MSSKDKFMNNDELRSKDKSGNNDESRGNDNIKDNDHIKDNDKLTSNDKFRSNDKFYDEIIRLLTLHNIKEPVIEKPKDSNLGDYAFPCFPLAKELKKAPPIIAQELAAKINASILEIKNRASKKSKLSSNLIKEAKAVGPFLNFFTDKCAFSKETLTRICKEKSKYGKGSAGKRVMVEFCSPNTNKPLHLGHVRNCVIGESVSNILKFNGSKITKACLVNDRGIHICKSMIAYLRWGEGKLPNIKSDFFVGKFYVMFAQKAAESVEKEKELEGDAQLLLQKWEQGDKATLTLWKRMNSWVYKGFGETYRSLGVKFDKYYYESQMYKEGKDIITDGLNRGKFIKDETGAIIADLEQFKLPKKVLIRGDGTSIYITQDIFLAKKKFDDYNLDQSIYVVGSEQNTHFQVLFKIMNILGYPWASQLKHLSYGMVYLPEGKMKSREGKVVDADDLVRGMTELARFGVKERHKDLEEKEIERRARIIGLGALKFYLLKTDFVKDMHYNPEESISFEGETGPYVQYTHARICSILKKLDEKFDKEFVKKVKFEVFDQKEQDIIKMLNAFPSIVEDAAQNLKPSIITRYLLDLCQKLNEFYHASQILKAPEDLLRARILLIHSSRQVIESGLKILGIDAPDEM